MKCRLGAIAVFLSSVPALAQPLAAYPTKLDGPRDCVTWEGFVESFASRSQNVHLQHVSERSTVELVFEVRSGGVRASVTIHQDESGPAVLRSLDAKSCFEAREAMAFVLALALEPGKVPSASPLPSEPTASGPRPSSRPPVATPASPQAFRWVFSLGILGGNIYGVTPELFLGGGAAATLERRQPRHALQPALRLQFRQLVAPDTQTSRGLAHFEASVATLELCPLRFQEGSLALQTCALGVLGSLLAEGKAIAIPTQERRVLGAVGASFPLSVALSGHLRVNLRAGVAGLLGRTTYQFDAEPFFESGPLILETDLGLFLEL